VAVVKIPALATGSRQHGYEIIDKSQVNPRCFLVVLAYVTFYETVGVRAGGFNSTSLLTATPDLRG
jgi:hypothetical protein